MISGLVFEQEHFVQPWEGYEDYLERLEIHDFISVIPNPATEIKRGTHAYSTRHASVISGMEYSLNFLYLYN